VSQFVRILVDTREELRLVLLTVNKSVSKLVGISTFLLLLIFKGILPQSAYAFLSSLDACAVQPECAAAIGSELSPTIAAPTAEAAATTAISTTTATGATTSSVQAVAGTTVVGDMRLSGVAAYYIWNKAQNQKAQEKAKERYCESHADIVACGGKGSPTGTAWFPNTITFTQQSDGSYYLYGKWITPNCTASPNYASGLGYFTNPYLLLVDFSPVPGCVGQVAIEGDPTQWKNWSQYLRNEAVNSLTSSDWQGLINSMPAGGILNPGDKVNAPTIVIPGQETDDPNTPVDERILKKQPGFFINPPDFDYDREPDESDVDDDDDGTPDYSDPKPQNPLVPEASSDTSSPSPDQSQNPPSTTPEPGIGGNGTASEFGDMTGMSQADADAFLRSLGATVKTTPDGYTQYKFPDRSEVWIRPDGEVVRTPAPKYGPDGSRINRGLRLNKDGSLLRTRDEFGNQIPGTHSTGEMVSN